MDNLYKTFYEDHIDRHKNISNPFEVTRINKVLSLIPDNVKTVLDAGCGDGRILNLLSEKYALTGCDLSFKALKFLQFPGIQSSLDYLPFKNKSFDLIICSEVLEHLPEKVLYGTIHEFQRVSAKYILISVPCKQNLNYQRVKCPQCKQCFNGWGHLRSFTEKDLANLMGDKWKISKYLLCRDSQTPYANWLLNIKQKLGGGWYWDNNLLCPHCGYSNFPQPQKNVITRSCNLLNRAIIPFLPKTFWLVGLFQNTSP
jgi:SAM-dependent methyltransferase